MKKQDFEKALTLARQAKQRKFKQSVEVIINFKGLNLKKPEEQIEFFHQFPHDTGKKRKVCAMVGGELKDQAQEHCDKVIMNDEFDAFDGKKKEIKQLASDYDYFIAQAPFMAAIAKTFGRFFGPKGKMPNPKAGCVVPPNANLELLAKKLHNTQKVSAKTKPLVQCLVGKETLSDAHIVDNIMSLYTALVHKLPGEESNIRSVYIKYTMGAPIKVGGEEVTASAPVKKAKEHAPKSEQATNEAEQAPEPESSDEATLKKAHKASTKAPKKEAAKKASKKGDEE